MANVPSEKKPMCRSQIEYYGEYSCKNYKVASKVPITYIDPHVPVILTPDSNASI